MKEPRIHLVPATPKSRIALRYLSAALAGVIALMYALISLGVLEVLENRDGQVIFGALAATAYAFGMVLLLIGDRKILWALGAAFQAFVIYTYFELAGTRTPHYEIWGLLIRIPQLFLLIGLLGLVMWPASAPKSKKIKGSARL